jgi:hypothetical protein
MATQRRRLRADDVPGIPITDPSIAGYELLNGELVPVMGRQGRASLVDRTGERSTP